MKLNPAQQKAITHKLGPLLIVAGAGTGKTTVITERIKYLIQQKNVDPQHIFATSFTHKSAEEMLKRLDTVMPLGYRQPWLGTFHSLCERLLRQEGLEIGLNPAFTVMTATDQWLFIKKHLFSFDLDYYRPLGNPNKFITALIKFFSRLSDEAVTPQEFEALVKDKQSLSQSDDQNIEAQRLSELYHAYTHYLHLKQTESVLDFGDLLFLTLKLFQTRPNLLHQFQSQFRHILIDEFQDTNFAQYALMKTLAPPANNPNLMVVGDDDQSIFKFRGASVSNILSFKADYPKAQTVILDQNYRSTQTILDAAYATIIHNNPDRLEPKLNLTKKLKSARPPAIPPSPQKIPDQTLPLEHEIGIFEAPTLEDEIDWTIKTIVDLVTVKGLSYKDIAILARANNHLEPYVAALKRAGLPYQLVANSGLFDQDEIKTLILFLKVLLDPSDAINLIQLSQSHIFNLSDPLMFAALKSAKQKSTSVWQEIQSIHEEPVAHFIKTILDYQQLAAETPVTQLLYRFIEATGYIKPWVQAESVDNQLKIKNLNLFFNHLKRFEATTNDKTIVGFLSVLDLWLEAGENPGQAQIEDIDTITLLTIHSAKGLEFEAVFVCSLITGRFPSTNRRDPIMVPNELIKETLPVGDEHIGEERRLFYVALTRAKQYLYLTFSKDVGGVRKRHPSGFLAETGLPHQTITPPTDPSPLQLVPTLDPQVRFIKQGQYVINKVSYSQIDTFKACPLKYKYRYLLQIPAKPHHSLSFGRTIHSTLHQFHAAKMQGKTLSLEEFLSLYDQNFIEDGYDSAEHKKQRYESGKAALTRYYHHYQKVLGQPQLLEQSFRLKLNGATLVGKIDRIDTNKSGEYEIVDYKTGSPKDQKKVDKDEQLTLYTLAAKEALGLDIQTASLYFLENGGQKVTTTRTPQEIAKAREKLIKDIGVMQASEFPAKPDPVKCGFCEFSSLCPFAATKKP